MKAQIPCPGILAMNTTQLISSQRVHALREEDLQHYLQAFYQYASKLPPTLLWKDYVVVIHELRKAGIQVIGVHNLANAIYDFIFDDEEDLPHLSPHEVCRQVLRELLDHMGEHNSDASYGSESSFGSEL